MLTFDGRFALLYWLLYQKLFPYFRLFRIFHYLTFRTVFASLTALLTGLLIGPYVIARLREFQIGQYIREEGPQSPPEEGWHPHHGRSADLHFDPGADAALVGPGQPVCVGGHVVDAGVRRHRVCRRLHQGGAPDKPGPDGPGEAGSAVSGKRSSCHCACRSAAAGGNYSTRLVVPFLKRFRPNLVIDSLLHVPHFWWLAFAPFVIFVMVVIAGASNAVNLTDGLDGLAIGCTIIAAGALTMLTYVSGHVVFSDYLELQRMPMVSELTIFCGAMVGASIGFLWYNAHPAEVFMGDVGSLALGGAIGTVAVIIKQELLLPLIGGVFIMELLSVVLQVGSYKLRNGKRIFKMAPLHHHFELLGWSESKVIARFWILALIFALLALTTLKLR